MRRVHGTQAFRGQGIALGQHGNGLGHGARRICQTIQLIAVLVVPRMKNCHRLAIA